MQLSRLADLQATRTMILARRNVTRRLTSSAKASSKVQPSSRPRAVPEGV